MRFSTKVVAECETIVSLGLMNFYCSCTIFNHVASDSPVFLPQFYEQLILQVFIFSFINSSFILNCALILLLLQKN